MSGGKRWHDVPFSTVRLLVPICAIQRVELFILFGMVRAPIDTRLGNGQEHSHNDLASGPDTRAHAEKGIEAQAE